MQKAKTKQAEVDFVSLRTGMEYTVALTMEYIKHPASIHIIALSTLNRVCICLSIYIEHI